MSKVLIRVEPYNWKAKILPTNISILNLTTSKIYYLCGRAERRSDCRETVWGTGKIRSNLSATNTALNEIKAYKRSPHSLIDLSIQKSGHWYTTSQSELLIALSTPIWLDSDTFTVMTYRIETERTMKTDGLTWWLRWRALACSGVSGLSGSLYDFIVFFTKQSIGFTKDVFVSGNKLSAAGQAAKTFNVIDLILRSHHEIILGYRSRALGAFCSK